MKKLDLNEMSTLQGGGYCQDLLMIISNNCLGCDALAGAWYGWNYGNCGSGYTFWSSTACHC